MRKATIAICVITALLTGCSSGLGALTGAIGSKPELSAQVGAENVKQGVGVSSKVDASTEIKTDLRDAKVGKVDSSSQKKVSNSSIQADVITAEKIEIRNSESGYGILAAMFTIGLMAGVMIAIGFNRRNKGA